MNPVNQLFPTVNGISPDWASIRLHIGLDTSPLSGAAPLLMVDDFAAINTSRAVEIGKKQGASGGRDTGRGTGAVSQECSVTFWREGYDKLLEALVAVAPRRGNQALISLVHFSIIVQHTPPGSTKIFDRRVRGCRIAGDTMNSAVGTDVQQVEVPLNVMQIIDIVNGVEVALL